MDVRRPEGSSPSHTLPSLSEGDNGAEPGSTRDFQGNNEEQARKFYTLHAQYATKSSASAID